MPLNSYKEYERKCFAIKFLSFLEAFPYLENLLWKLN